MVTFTATDVDEDGNEVVRSGAELPDVEGESGDAAIATDECVDGELPLMDATVEDALLRASPDETLDISFLVVADSSPLTFGPAWAVANLESIGGDAPDPVRVRADVADARRESLRRPLEVVRAAIEEAGGEIVEVAELSGTVEARLTGALLADVLVLPEVAAAEVPAEAVEDFYSWTTPDWSTGEELDGDEIEEIIQSRILYRHPVGPYLGASVALGTTEPDADKLFLYHPGWNDGSGARRVSNCDWSPYTSSCSAYFPVTADRHATAVASVIVGDITLGQDPNYGFNPAQRKRSGVARAATLVGFDDGSRAAVEAWATTAFQGTLINHSAHYLENCSGNTDWARTVNAIYESGIAWFNAMGNKKHDDVALCNAGGEAAALGAFAVNAITWDDAATTSGMAPLNSRGGVGSSPADGRSRAIVGIAAPTNFAYPYAHTVTEVDCSGAPMIYGADWPDSPPCGPEGIGRTSGATPVVTGAAAIFKDYFLDAFNSYIEDPGALYTNLLLMGDRQSTVWNADPFDNMWGAGRLRLRAFDAYGLDNPAGWSTGDLCVDSLATVSLPMAALPNSGQPVGSAADHLRVVSWWYDGRVDDGIGSHDHDNVDLRVVRSTSQTYNSTLDDSRQRITIDSAVGGSSFEIKFIGRDVTADNEGCGTNSMRVYWAWMYEDTARDDTDLDLDGVAVMDYTRVDP